METPRRTGASIREREQRHPVVLRNLVDHPGGCRLARAILVDVVDVVDRPDRAQLFPDALQEFARVRLGVREQGDWILAPVHRPDRDLLGSRRRYTERRVDDATWPFLLCRS